MTTHQQIISATQLDKLVSSWINREEINMKIISGEVIEGIIVSLHLKASNDQCKTHDIVLSVAKDDKLTFTTLLLAEKDQQGTKQQHGWTPKGQGGF